ncbi:leucyl/phenylalanyl-tRNA--protein transferase [Dinoroseobacter sp. PD6]|uniref:leucyl/phenylalanyl-tRNA--protein transferase n=1 Tax=Dinoroseobacter sp. PD6 TaxID=3028384 RepID=UPI00237BA525|nr:leucyl/phenylalanyl-tRNA--protein transferase [Dinoroseobacter sp. PD6]MDD9716238.1 leucyl/phenylalanyl-tRNA--protein transferase [Dinoroseobacter sp. PD6]
MAHDMYPNSPPRLTPDLLLRGYMAGIFPMAEARDDDAVFWVDPRQRGVLPLDGVHVSRKLRRFMARTEWTLSLNQDFAGVVAGCADRDETWINDQIFDAYTALHAMGFAHALEVREDGALIGGVYGVAIGTAFFGESMFSRRPNGSKVALVALCAHLRRCGYTLFDTQFVTPHLATMGAVEISRDSYRAKLRAALSAKADLTARPLPRTPAQILAPGPGQPRS